MSANQRGGILSTTARVTSPGRQAVNSLRCLRTHSGTCLAPIDLVAEHTKDHGPPAYDSANFARTALAMLGSVANATHTIQETLQTFAPSVACVCVEGPT
eukprot:6460539-Amphidinium_carterae.1